MEVKEVRIIDPIICAIAVFAFISIYRKILGIKVFLPPHPQPQVKLFDEFVVLSFLFLIPVFVALGLFGIPQGSTAIVVLVIEAYVVIFLGALIYFPIEFALTKLVKNAEPYLWPNPTVRGVAEGIFAEFGFWFFIILVLPTFL